MVLLLGKNAAKRINVLFSEETQKPSIPMQLSALFTRDGKKAI